MYHRAMSTSDASRPGAGEVRVHFDRGACLGWAAFCATVAAACVVVAVVAPHAAFASGLVPGWLFGSVGAGLFGVVGVSWAARFTCRDPGLVIGDEGIELNPRLGGPFTPTIRGKVIWQDIESVVQGKHGSVLLELRDPDGFWARQSRFARAVAWSPHPGRRQLVPIGGKDLEMRSDDLRALVATRREALRAESEDPPGLERGSSC